MDSEQDSEDDDRVSTLDTPNGYTTTRAEATLRNNPPYRTQR